jgi:hypothetical protein
MLCIRARPIRTVNRGNRLATFEGTQPWPSLVGLNGDYMTCIVTA